jgi:hypothetical protein
MTTEHEGDVVAMIMEKLVSVTRRLVDERTATVDVSRTSIIVTPNSEHSASVGVFVTPDQVSMCFGQVAVDTPSIQEFDILEYERLLRATIEGRIKERFRHFLGLGIGSEALITLEDEERHYVTGMRPARSAWQQRQPYY